MNLFWLLLAFLPSILHATCNSVFVFDNTYATGICYKHPLINEWWKFECTSANISSIGGRLIVYASAGCTSNGVVPPQPSSQYDCSGQTCGFLQIDSCTVGNATSTNTTHTPKQFPHPLGRCFVYTTKPQNGSNVTMTTSYKYECCQDGKTILQTNWIGTRTCTPGLGVVKSTEFRYNGTCMQQINLIDGRLLKNYVKAENVICGTSPPASCPGLPTLKPTSGPSSSPTITPPKTTTTSSAPGTTKSTTTSTTTSHAPSNVSSTTTGVPHNGTISNTTVPAGPSSGGDKKPKKVNIALVLGLSIGVLLLCCLAGAVYWWMKRTTKTGILINDDAYTYEPLVHERTAGQSAHQEDVA